ncbi:1-deoxy-D-xylulose-5-phosphate synthase [Coprococcus catus]|jgi:1-deoxy-D-xylulose-5-phosphate synthase|uniref:1-deoxy-D-xylulose-5-phosphate synthase n=1 Tax=Coprococcus TaxID=33042 RepID=UPI001C00B931|nr:MULTISPECIES: 1-deoxy-D-xylulose-5-phosphate synthase [Coprococcus]MBT9768461.1 1-deoxy-D-xylulose-5-phosphate synthase [Coprococcus catus]MCM0662668.1 1-deoxy-D-xylulose-5-phosphate synthase [Coprococcus sp. B2-R-112]MCO7144933.1 1-deoxy-D-xylulose-5-phosphate synthase [Coprococcus catus]MEE0818021.1 1-deoxy-D-xylulose-5-phosphate synthase [Coprococcus catus]
MSGYLDRINEANDIKKIEPEAYDALASEIRSFIIESVSEHGGHLASNLGVVELTMALHLCMDFPNDKLIWDVGHQAYTHKLLTGRKEDFSGLRTFGGMSGFPKHKESPCDAFDTGHSSTSISAALGYARARDLKGEDRTVVAVIGDGSLTGGMAYEALNNVSHLKSNMIIVLNDNKMSISENVGGLSKHLTALRTRESYMDFKMDVEKKLKQIPHVGDSVARSVKKSKDSIRQLFVKGGFFEDFGIKYIGPIDGHDIKEMVRVLNALKRLNEPVVMHVVTQKGRGYVPAEQNPSAFHGVGSFDIATGESLASKSLTYTSVFSKTICRLGKAHPDVVTICAAMPDGTGLTAFKKHFPGRFFDVGIAEQHAVTFAAGLAAGGMHPFVAVYSSFLQRAYDQIIHDVCIQNLPVVFCVDRAGLVGADGETHQGIFDLSYLSMIPNMTVCAPKNKYELYDMLYFAYQYHGPIAIRYPRGSAYEGFKNMRPPIEYGKSELMFEGEKIALVAVGSMVQTAVQVREKLLDKGINATVVNARFVCPLDTECLDRLSRDHQWIVTMEENVLKGGFGEACGDYLLAKHEDVRLIHVGVPDVYVEHGGVDQLKKTLHMDADSIVERICSAMSDADD